MRSNGGSAKRETGVLIQEVVTTRKKIEHAEERPFRSCRKIASKGANPEDGRAAKGKRLSMEEKKGEAGRQKKMLVSWEGGTRVTTPAKG